MRLLQWLALALLSQPAFSQLTGTVVTNEDVPVPFANVALFTDADSTLVNGTTTDEQGHYAIEARKGLFFLRLSAIGYKTMVLPPFEADGPMNLGKVVMVEESYKLDEVVVQATKPIYTQEIDRTVVNVENSIMTKGSTALQLLERSPGVFVDVRSGSISMNGKSGVMVMLNGKLMRVPADQLMAMLRSMNGGDVEKIELLPMPPASYDADGSAGMINIVTKRSVDLGTNGTISLGAGYGWKEKANLSVSLSRNRVKDSWYGAYSFMHDRALGGWSAVGTQLMPSLGGRMDVNVVNLEKANINNHNLSFGFERKVNTVSFGGNVSVSGSIVAREVSNDAMYRIRDSDSVLVMNSFVEGKNRWINSIIGVYASKEFKRGRLSADFDYIDFRNDSPTEVHNSFTDADGNEGLPPGSIFLNRQRGRARSPISILVGKSDYSLTLNDKMKIESGAKATYSSSRGVSYIENLDGDQWQGSDRMTNNIDVYESILAAYTLMNIKPSSTFEITAGARFEYSRTTSDSEKAENEIDRKLARLFPNIVLSKKMSERSDVQLSFSQRVTRPSYNDLSSNLVYTDPMSAFTGNPLLRPTITTSIRGAYNVSGYLFSMLASRDNYPIVRYQLSENATHDLMYVSAQNMRYQNSLTVTAVAPLKVSKWWEMSYSLNGSVRKFQVVHTKRPEAKVYTTWSVNGSNIFTLPKRFTIEFSGWYTADQYDGSKRLAGFGSINVGVKKDFDKGSLQLAITDMFQTLKFVNRYGLLTDEAFFVQSDVPYRPESARFHMVKVTWTHTFGSGKRGSSRSVEEGERIRKE